MGNEAYKKPGWQPEDPATYEMFILWCQMPKILKEGKPEVIAELNLDVPEFQPLIGIKTQTQFAEIYGVNISTLSQWKHAPRAEGFEHISWENLWAKDLTKDVALALYAGAMKHGDAGRVKLYMQMFGGFVEKSYVEHPQAEDHFRVVGEILEELKNDKPEKEESGEKEPSTVILPEGS